MSITHEWWLDYETVIKLRQMDPGKAEAYKKVKWIEYQKKRIANSIANLREDYYLQVKDNPEQKEKYAQLLRQGIVNIPWIQEFEEFKEIYQSSKDQLEGLVKLQEDVDQSDVPVIDQPGMDELSSDEPDTSTVEQPTEEQTEQTQEDVEAAERAAVDAKIDDTQEDIQEEQVQDEAPAQEDGAIDADAQYIAKFGEEKFNKLPGKFKNDKEWLLKKANE